MVGSLTGVVASKRVSYNQFNVGREVYINLKGLYVGENASGLVVTPSKTPRSWASLICSKFAVSIKNFIRCK